jgi:hypothetical protein
MRTEGEWRAPAARAWGLFSPTRSTRALTREHCPARRPPLRITRSYLLSGYCSNVTGNSGHINRQISGKGPYETVDGEGVRCALNTWGRRSGASTPAHATALYPRTPRCFPFSPPPLCQILHQSQNGNWGKGDLIAHNDLSGGSSGYILNCKWPVRALGARKMALSPSLARSPAPTSHTRSSLQGTSPPPHRRGGKTTS